MKPILVTIAAAIVLQCLPTPASAARRGFLWNFTAHTLALKLVVNGRPERADLPPHHQLILPSGIQGASGSVTVNGKTCVASTTLQSSSEVTFEYYANDGRCTFKRWVG